MNSHLTALDLIHEKVFSVSEYIDFLNNVLSATPVTLQGEVGEKMSIYPRFGYFSLLDGTTQAVIDCFSWKGTLDSLGIPLEEGMEIRVFGYPSIYKSRGTFNFQVQRIELVGEGGLKKQFEMLKVKLKREGLFRPEKKKPLPELPRRIGLITSSQARGAKKDFLHNLTARGLSVQFYNVRVEGPKAVPDICDALRWFNEHEPRPDVLIVTRGGGSWESLSAFNNEDVARSIFASEIPVIVGVGHEDDTTIADYVCDYRASTPTDAAKVISESWEKVPYVLDQYGQSLKTNFARACERIEVMTSTYVQTWSYVIENMIEASKSNLIRYEENLNLSDPLRMLKNGYALVRSDENSLIKNISSVSVGSYISVQLSDGKIRALVAQVLHENSSEDDTL